MVPHGQAHGAAVCGELSVLLHESASLPRVCGAYVSRRRPRGRSLPLPSLRSPQGKWGLEAGRRWLQRWRWRETVRCCPITCGQVRVLCVLRREHSGGRAIRFLARVTVGYTASRRGLTGEYEYIFILFGVQMVLTLKKLFASD